MPTVIVVVLLFLAVVLPGALIIAAIVRTFRATARQVDTWLASSVVGRGDLTWGAPAVVSFAAQPGADYSVWLDLELDAADRRFELSVVVTEAGITQFEWAGTAWLAGGEDDALLGLPPNIGTGAILNSSAFGTRCKGIYRVLLFTPRHGGSANVQVRFAPQGEMKVERAAVLVGMGTGP